ncbi:hypothetical protein [Streptomyces griseoluteus]|uniref:hypothetical protein n=1 Tax=Streptomyces griseoluteus TaxID=29306 RepID=UPI0036EAF55B
MGEVCDPYGERALLTSAMVGRYEAVPTDELNRLRTYLEAVVAARPSPVHATVAFNALYFGFDLHGDCYGNSPLRLDDFPVVAFGESAPPLPVGAMVRVSTGSEPLFAEIVYKEGAHPETGDLGEVPAWLSGAPAGAEGPGRPGNDSSPLRRELLVPDVGAFGPALTLTPAQLHRLRARRRWVNEDGHVVVDIRYPSREAAAQGDLAAYADYLLSTARSQLLSPYVPVSLAELVGSTQDEALRPGLLRLLDMVQRVLASSDQLRMWGPYAMTRESLAKGWRDTGPLGGDDLRTLAATVERSAAPTRRRYGLSAPVTVYTAVGPRLRAVPGATDLLRGVGYAAAVCRANVALADVVQRDSEQGLFPNSIRVTLDDAFEGGGIWRSHHPGDTETTADPLLAAGRGWRSLVGTKEDAVPEPVDSPLADDAELGPVELLRTDETEVAWRLPLRLAHLIDGSLPLRPYIARELCRIYGGRLAVRLELAHPRGLLEPGEDVQHVTAEVRDDTGHLTGITWPAAFFPGLMLELCWPRGAREIRVSTTLLDRPVQVGDRWTGHRYDPRVLTREDAPGSDRYGDTAVGLGPRQLVMRTVRRCGLLTVDGHALLDRAGLPLAAYGRVPERSQILALESGVEQLLTERLLQPAVGSRSVHGQPWFPARTGEPTIPLIGYRPQVARVPTPWGGTGPDSEPLRTVQFVPGHLRRLLPGRVASDAQRAAFREHCRRLGKADGWELPEGYTFVNQHTRGH